MCANVVHEKGKHLRALVTLMPSMERGQEAVDIVNVDAFLGLHSVNDNDESTYGVMKRECR